MEDTANLMQALVARDEAGIERSRAAALRRFLPDADHSWLRAPPRWPLPPLLLLLAALASAGAVAAEVRSRSLTKGSTAQLTRAF